MAALFGELSNLITDSPIRQALHRPIRPSVQYRVCTDYVAPGRWCFSWASTWSVDLAASGLLSVLQAYCLLSRSYTKIVASCHRCHHRCAPCLISGPGCAQLYIVENMESSTPYRLSFTVPTGNHVTVGHGTLHYRYRIQNHTTLSNDRRESVTIHLFPAWTSQKTLGSR
jgi:hypothetical protein